MCGRVVVNDTGIEEFTDRIGAKWVQSDLLASPQYNLPSGGTLPVVRHAEAGPPEGLPLVWGLVPFWAKDPKIGYKMSNARAETITEKPSFRAPFKSRRCLVLVSAFFEWKDEGGKKKQPYFIHRADGKPWAFGGLWERNTQATPGRTLES